MRKTLGATVAVFSTGGIAMALLSHMLGALAESAALAWVGAGLIGASHLLGSKLATTAPGATVHRALKSLSR